MTRSTPFRFHLFKIALGILAALALTISPQAAFAQRAGARAGGGGHSGGGAHIGGGGHFGGNAGFGASSHSFAGSRASSPIHVFSGPRSAPAAAAPARGGENSAALNGGGRGAAVELRSSGISTSSNGLPLGLAASADPLGGDAAGVNLDAHRAMPLHTTIGFPPDRMFTSSARGREPLSFSGQGGQVWRSSQYAAANPDSVRLTEARAPQHVFPKPPHVGRRPILAGPGLLVPPAFLFGSPIYGLYGPGFDCDPFWAPAFGCGGIYANGFGAYSYLGFGGGYDGYDGGAYYAPSASGYDIAPDDTDQGTSQEPAPSEWQNPPADNSSPDNSDAENATPAPDTVIYLKDGTSFAVSDYWVADGQLHYVASYGGENAVALSQLDLQRTTDANASRGVSITLRPAPESQPPDTQPQPPPAARPPTPPTQ
jgi:hypothetical protein